MDKSTLERHLAQAQDDVGEAQRILESLRPSMARPSQGGPGATTGNRLLATLEEALRRHIDERDRLTRELADWESRRPLFHQPGPAQRSNGAGANDRNGGGASACSGIAIALLDLKFRSLGVDVRDLGRLALIAKHVGRIAAGTDIVRAGETSRHSTLLLEGVACLCKRLEDGTRQIYAFKYPGDFWGVLPEPDDAVAVQALSGCSIAAVDHSEMERVIARSDTLGLALWRSMMLDTFIFRERIANVGRLAAMPRVAHLLCEQLVRREAVGLTGAVLPITQIDLADAAGLSVVHVNRTIQALRKLEVLSSASSAIEVIDRKQLARIGRFDGRYLNMPRLLSHWTISVVP
jgi:CRP-like cAMP-binding protein